ncbi:hypothetical protein C8R43DRAFT_945708 [Mycena crocata]|nr:hypothetical protein C8R43DRAFT_945708 [Mycena crocata]
MKCSPERQGWRITDEWIRRNGSMGMRIRTMLVDKKGAQVGIQMYQIYAREDQRELMQVCDEELMGILRKRSVEWYVGHRKLGRVDGEVPDTDRGAQECGDDERGRNTSCRRWIRARRWRNMEEECARAVVPVLCGTYTEERTAEGQDCRGKAIAMWANCTNSESRGMHRRPRERGWRRTEHCTVRPDSEDYGTEVSNQSQTNYEPYEIER